MLQLIDYNFPFPRRAFEILKTQQKNIKYI